jgi:hypothetical protein
MKGRSVSVKGMAITQLVAKKTTLVRWTAYAFLFLGLSCGVPFFYLSAGRRTVVFVESAPVVLAGPFRNRHPVGDVFCQ